MVTLYTAMLELSVHILYIIEYMRCRHDIYVYETNHIYTIWDLSQIINDDSKSMVFEYEFDEERRERESMNV